MISPNKKRFTNVVGEYIYDCLSPNCLCYIVAMPLVFNLNGIQGDNIEILQYTFWLTLIIVQLGRMMVFIEQHVCESLWHVSKKKGFY